MDPITAIGIAGSIVQFVDFGLKVVSKGNHIYRSGDGSLSEDHDLEVLTKDLVLFNARMQYALQPAELAAGLSQTDQALKDLSATSKELAEKLLERLNMVKAQGRLRRWKSFRQALKSVWSKAQIDEMARRLSLVKEQLQLRILVSLRETVDLNALHHSESFDLLYRTSKEILDHLHGVCSTGDQKLENHIECSTREHECSDGVVGQNSKDIIAAINRLAKAFRGREADPGRDSLRRVQSREVAETAILKSFAFDAMEDRYCNVADAHARTFSWIFEKANAYETPWDDFVAWLENGNDLYWINGKAASGKSTLMKYIFNEPRLKISLDQWASNTKLVCARFYFWHLGTNLQKSHAGLLRSILYQAFDQCRELIPHILPDLWKRTTSQSAIFLESLTKSWHTWALTDLQAIFERLIKQKQLLVKFCFFIDGLDEFDGEHTNVAALFKLVASYAHTKVCVSSRPLMIFEQEFASCPKLHLQDLTANDIMTYVHDNLNGHRRIADLNQRDPKAISELAMEVCEMSSGVFLWVTLAVKSLLEGLTNLDGISDLQARLRELPPELDDLFSLMLRAIKPSFYFRQASRLLQIVYQSESQLSATELSFADEEDESLVFKLQLSDIAEPDGEARLQAITARVKTRCAGLLEMHKASKGHARPDFYVQYLHLTVKEFLAKPGIWNMLRESTRGTNFDAYVSLLRSDILSLKTTAPTTYRIHRAVRYASRAESSTGYAQEDLLDELDKVGHSLQWFSDVQNSKSLRYAPLLEHQTEHWFNNIGLDGPRSYAHCPSFLHYAILNNLSLYVKAKIGRQFTLINSAGQQPLLAYAIFSNKLGPLGCNTQPSMLATLLQAGADPNEKLNNTTPWREVLMHLYRTSRIGKSLSRNWLDICRLLVLYGANPRAYVVTERLEYVSALQVVSRAFLHLPQASVEDLKILLIQRGALRESSHKMRRGKRKFEDSHCFHPQPSNDRLGYAPNRWDSPGLHRDIRAVSSSVATNFQDVKPLSLAPIGSLYDETQKIQLLSLPPIGTLYDETRRIESQAPPQNLYNPSFIAQSQMREQQVYYQPSTSQPRLPTPFPMTGQAEMEHQSWGHSKMRWSYDTSHQR